MKDLEFKNQDVGLVKAKPRGAGPTVCLAFLLDQRVYEILRYFNVPHEMIWDGDHGRRCSNYTSDQGHHGKAGDS